MNLPEQNIIGLGNKEFKVRQFVTVIHFGKEEIMHVIGYDEGTNQYHLQHNKPYYGSAFYHPDKIKPYS